MLYVCKCFSPSLHFRSCNINPTLPIDAEKFLCQWLRCLAAAYNTSFYYKMCILSSYSGAVLLHLENMYLFLITSIPFIGNALFFSVHLFSNERRLL